MAEDSAEKTEKPTPQRREKARKEGQVPVSQEVGVALAVFALTMAVSSLLPWSMSGYLQTFGEMMTPALDGPLTVEDAQRAVEVLLVRSAMIAGPVALLALVLGTMGSLLQAGVSVNWENVGPKWNRLNPQNWLKKVFSVELPVNIFKAFFKGMGVVAVAILGVYDLPERLWRLSAQPPLVVGRELQEIALAVTSRVVAALICLAIFDVFWTRYRHEQKLMMSRQEIKDELKDSEGNPHVKGAMRRRMNEVANKRLKDAVSEATVVTTNPTHYAVALRYWRGRDSSPVVVAKGADYKAQKIRAYARELGIPVVEDKPLARALYAVVREGQHVPVDLFRNVARLLAIVYRRRGYLAGGKSS